MDSAQELLFGGFPRAVGVTTPDHSGMELRQYLVHSDREFDGVLEQVEGARNVYASLSEYEPVKVDGSFAGSAVVADKVSFDFDSPAKADPDTEGDWSSIMLPQDADEHEVIDRMRESEQIREEVLGDICEDARKLAQASIDEDIPVFGVFSGFGLHVHQLYEPTRSRPGDKMGSNCRRWVSELTLPTADSKASGKPFRIMRVPNIERIDHADGEETSTGLYTVPLTGSELAEITPRDLTDLSRGPRPTIGSEPRSRPEMKVDEDYLGPGQAGEVGQEKMRPTPDETMASSFAEEVVKEITQMPCVWERAIGRNPPNDVRVKLGIMMLNAGYSVGEATDIIAQLNWVDFDRETTRYQLRSLKKSGKGDWSCRTMQSKGLCTRADDKVECPGYGYRGGNKPWQT